jgi:hypothetical protein
MPTKQFQKPCSPACAIEWAKSEGKLADQKERFRKAERASNNKALKVFNESRVYWWLDYTKNGTTAWWFHRYIRYRDGNEPCISCDTTTARQWHCSHFRSRGAAGQLRLNPDNCHKSCSQCNKENSGNIGEYRIRLVKKIGLEKVEALENNHDIKRWDVEELRELRDYWKAECKKLEAL